MGEPSIQDALVSVKMTPDMLAAFLGNQQASASLEQPSVITPYVPMRLSYDGSYKQQTSALLSSNLDGSLAVRLWIV